MNIASIEKTIGEYLKILNPEEQKQILQFAHALTMSKHTGISGQSLLSFAGFIDKQYLNLMNQAIERECERVIRDEW